jgi:hypothetical protein
MIIKDARELANDTSFDRLGDQANPTTGSDRARAALSKGCTS